MYKILVLLSGEFKANGWVFLFYQQASRTHQTHFLSNSAIHTNEIICSHLKQKLSTFVANDGCVTNLMTLPCRPVL